MTFPANIKRRLSPDNDDLAVWRCNNQSTTIVNTGVSGSGANMTANANMGVSIPGVFTNCIHLPDTTSTNSPSAETAAGVVQPANAITVSAWIFVRDYINTPTGTPQGRTVTKSYNNNTWSAPLLTISLCEFNSDSANIQTGGWTSYIRTTTSVTIIQTTTDSIITLHEWHHVGITYNGNVFNQYLDGILVGSTSLSGAIDYGTNGEWFIGSPRTVGAAADEAFVGLIEDIRIAQIARPASWFKDTYGMATGIWRP